jgi:ABC-type Zn uptake system ZnuABC Zn-binding protein ZnuA
MKRRFLQLLSLAVAGGIAVGAALSLPSAPARAQIERSSVIGSTTLIADVVQQVAGKAANVSSLMAYGVDPHSYEPSAQDIVALDEADLIFVNGAGFEEGLLPVLEEAAGDKLVMISLCAPILPFGMVEEEHGEEEHAEEGHHPEGDANLSATAALCEQHIAELTVAGVTLDYEHEHAEGEAEHDHAEALGPLYKLDCGIGHEGEKVEDGEHADEHGSCDPHLWTDARNVMLWTLMARDALSQADPANAETYRANAKAYLEQLQRMDAEVGALLQSIPEAQRVLVTNHETLGYLAARYGFRIVGTVIPGGSTANEPSAQDIAALIETIKDNNVRTIFSENTVSDALAQQLADETGAIVYKLYSDSLTDADGEAHTYLDYMRFNAATIVQGLTRQ